MVFFRHETWNWRKDGRKGRQAGTRRRERALNDTQCSPLRFIDACRSHFLSFSSAAAHCIPYEMCVNSGARRRQSILQLIGSLAPMATLSVSLERAKYKVIDEISHNYSHVEHFVSIWCVFPLVPKKFGSHTDHGLIIIISVFGRTKIRRVEKIETKRISTISSSLFINKCEERCSYSWRSIAWKWLPIIIFRGRVCECACLGHSLTQTRRRQMNGDDEKEKWRRGSGTRRIREWIGRKQIIN